jgi:hypothetical protein
MATKTDGYLRLLARGQRTDAGLAFADWHTAEMDDPQARAELRAAGLGTETGMAMGYDVGRQDVQSLFPFGRLRKAMNEHGKVRVDDLACAALACSEIDQDAPIRLGTLLRSASGGTLLINPDRVRILLGAQEPELFLTILRSMLSMLRPQRPGRVVRAGVPEIAEVAMWWARPESRAWARRQVWNDYHDPDAERILDEAAA